MQTLIEMLQSTERYEPDKVTVIFGECQITYKGTGALNNLKL